MCLIKPQHNAPRHYKIIHVMKIQYMQYTVEALMTFLINSHKHFNGYFQSDFTHMQKYTATFCLKRYNLKIYNIQKENGKEKKIPNHLLDIFQLNKALAFFFQESFRNKFL